MLREVQKAKKRAVNDVTIEMCHDGVLKGLISGFWLIARSLVVLLVGLFCTWACKKSVIGA